jgi:hypothetical protein
MKQAIIFSVRVNQTERSSGSHRIATHLRQEGMDVEVIDFAAHWSLDQLQELVRSRYTYNMVFFGFSTFYSHWNNTMEEFAVWLKLTYPSVATIIGGQHVLTTPTTNIDYWIDSFGELAITALVKSLSSNGDPVAFETINNKQVIRALHSYPAYPLESYATIFENRDFLQYYEFVTIEFSRGCKFSCKFCNFPILNVKEDNSRSGNDLRNELMYNYDNFGITSYHIADETANDRIEKILKYSEVVDGLPFKPWFNGFARADLLVAHKPYWDHYAAMRFGGQYYGVETFDNTAAKLVGKGMNTDTLKQGMLDAKEYFTNKIPYRGTISMIVGLPGETESSWQSSIKWLTDNWTSEALVVYPLEVPAPTSTHTNKSEFTNNPSKYKLTIKDISTPSNVMFKETTGWTHDTMTSDRAMELVKEFLKNYSNLFSYSGWSLGTHMIGNHTDNLQINDSSIDNLLKINRLNSNTTRTEELYTARQSIFLNEYITRKLNWIRNA